MTTTTEPTTTTTKGNTMKKSTAHQNATAKHAAALEKTAEVAALLQATEADLAALESVDAAQLLSDPAKAVQVAEGRAKLSHLAKIHAEMLAAAQQAEADAARAVVALEAEEMGPAIAAATAVLNQWLARQSELLDQLEQHTGVRFVRPPRDEHRNPGETITRKAPADAVLLARVELLKAQQAALQAAAQGQDPADVCPVDSLPDSLMPGGILPSRYAVTRAAEDAQRAGEEAEAARVNAEDGQRLTAACTALGMDPAEVEKLDRWERPEPGTVHRWHGDAELALTIRSAGDATEALNALMVLAELAGTDVANSALTRLQVTPVS